MTEQTVMRNASRKFSNLFPTCHVQ